MSYYQFVRVLRQLCANNQSGCYIFKQSALNLRNVILNDRWHYLRSISSLPNIESKANLPKYQDVKTQISSLLQDNSNLRNDNTLLALHYCGKSSPSLTINQRRTLAEEIWESLSDFSDVLICHAYLQACIDNDVSVNYVEYLKNIKFNPNIETFKLLLESVCNVGDNQSALKILEILKKENYSVDIDVFNLLVLGYSISGGYNATKSILEMMKLARIKTNDVTNWNILRGVATFNKSCEFLDILEQHTFVFMPELFLDVVYRIGIEDNLQNIKKFLNKFKETEVPRHLNNKITDLCIHLIIREKPNIAFEIYCLLVEPFDENYGMSLFQEMIRFRTPNEIVITLAKHLMNRNLHPTALQSITNFALRNKFFDTSLALFKAYENLKPHFFWPLLIEKSKENGQIGVFEVIQTMQTMQVPIDADTIHFYVVPYCDLSDPKLLINNLKQFNFSAKEVFTPILATLLARNDISCIDLCKHFNVSVDGHRLQRPLINFYKTSRNFDVTVMLLKRICDTNIVATDWTGMFLLKVVKGPKNNSDLEDYLNLLKVARGVKLSISAQYFGNIMTYLQVRTRDYAFMRKVEVALKDLVDSTKQEMEYIQHPRNMNIDDLECHLIELNEQEMDTKGVLRKLIQEHSRLGNHERLMELRQVYKNLGFAETPGMKGSIMNSLIALEKLDEASHAYNDIKNNFSSFNIDSFKIIDLATLLVKSDQFDDAMDLLQKETANIRNTASPFSERNCRMLLSSCSTPDQVETLFKYLIDHNVCKISNIILGPLVKIHLISDNLVSAMKVYKKCVERYRCTPLQLELLTKIVQKEDSQDLLHEVVALTASIHGIASAKIGLLAALAENGYEKPITRFLMENKALPAKLVQARCDRWITENKLPPLLTLLKSMERLPANIFDKSVVQNAVLKFHISQQDCDSALEFYEQLRSKDIEVNSEFIKNLLALLTRYKYNIPESLCT